MSRKDRRYKTKYIVKPENKLVVAILQGFPQPLDIIRRSNCSNFLLELAEFNCGWLSTAESMLFDDGKEFKAEARCYEDDVFDELRGKEIASIKTKIKYKKLVQKKFIRLFDALAKASTEVMDLINGIDCEIKELENKYGEYTVRK